MDGRREHVWVVEDDRGTALLLASFLEEAGHQVEQYAEASLLMAALQRTTPACVLLDLGLPGMHGLEALRRVRLRRPGLPVVIVTSSGAPETVVAAMRAGAADYLVKPVDRDRLISAVERALSEARATEAPADAGAGAAGAGAAGAGAAGAVGWAEVGGTGARDGAGDAAWPAPSDEGLARVDFHGLVGAGPAMRHLVAQIRKVAATDVSVLISGESGVGKDLVAQAVHAEGARRDGPFVAVNCGAIAESLQDSELFGHERGAFTGANGKHRGVFERAEGGTVFLDEVAELSPGTQVRLLRVLQNRELVRVGGERPVPVNVRILSATHQDLRQAVTEGRFREDLFYRLVVYPLWVPPLRDHLEDLAALVRCLARRAGAEVGCDRAELSPEALARLRAYDWPGNVRELENVVRWAMVNAACGQIEARHLPPALWAGEAAGLVDGSNGGGVSGPAPGAPAPQTHAGVDRGGVGGGGEDVGLGPVALEDAADGAGAADGAADGAAGGAGADPALGLRLPSSPYVVTLPTEAAPGELLEHAEREAIIAALLSTQGRVVAAARKLGLSRATLYRRLQRYGLSAEEFRERTERMPEPGE